MASNLKRSSIQSRVIRVLIVTLIAVCALGLYAYLAYWVPHQKLSSVLMSTGSVELTQEVRMEVRQVCHQIISHRLGNHHDAFLTLETVGNHESVPLLIRALKWHPVDPSGVTICTTTHCLDALKVITGNAEAGTVHEWEAWWEQHQDDYNKE